MERPNMNQRRSYFFMVLPIHIVTRITLILQKKETTGEVLSILNYRGEQLIKSLIETKLTSNPQLRHGIEIQLPIYMKQEKTKQAIYLIIDNGHPKALEHFIAFYNELDKEIKRKISYFIIDATMRPSASKA